jgi:hypothetical protein
VRTLVVIVAAGLGALFGVGCVVAALFELQGFGAPRDSDPRTLYLFSLGLGLAACVAVPLALWQLLLPERSPGWALVAAPVVVIGVVWLLGLAVAS